jgi:hypothetical protein
MQSVHITTNVVSSNPAGDALDTTLCDKVCQWLTASQWLSSGTPVSSTNKSDRYDIAEILLKVALNTTTITLVSSLRLVILMALYIYNLFLQKLFINWKMNYVLEQFNDVHEAFSTLFFNTTGTDNPQC